MRYNRDIIQIQNYLLLYQYSQKIKLLENYEFNYLTIILTQETFLMLIKFYLPDRCSK